MQPYPWALCHGSQTLYQDTLGVPQQCSRGAILVVERSTVTTTRHQIDIVLLGCLNLITYTASMDFCLPRVIMKKYQTQKAPGTQEDGNAHVTASLLQGQVYLYCILAFFLAGSYIEASMQETTHSKFSLNVRVKKKL